MLPCVAVICWALLSIEEVGNTIEDPFNMPFLFSGQPRDELQLERSFHNIRGDVRDRSPAPPPPLPPPASMPAPAPAPAPAASEASTAAAAAGGTARRFDLFGARGALQQVAYAGRGARGTWRWVSVLAGAPPRVEAPEVKEGEGCGNAVVHLCLDDYDVTAFHRSAVPSHRLSLTSPASVAAVGKELLRRYSQA